MFERLFKYPESDFDAGALTFTSGYPVWLLVVLAALVALVLAFSLFRQRSHLSTGRLTTIWALQSAVAALLLLLIWQPSLDVKTLRSGENAVALVVDNSASMSYVHENESRLQKALSVLQQDISPGLANTFAIQYATVGEQLQLTDDLSTVPAPEFRTNITGTLLEILDQARAEPLAAVVIASDGSDNSETLDSTGAQQEFWDQLAAFNVPVHTIGIGREVLPEDMEITNVEMAATTLPGSLERATVTVRHGGRSQTETARIKVYAGENLIALQEQPLPEEPGEITLSIDINVNEVGLKVLRFEAEPSAEDTITRNNSRSRLLQVEEKQRKILYFEGEPRWEYKFIRRAVGNSKGVSLVTILRTTPNKFYRQGISSPEQHANGFPVTKAELYAYDAVIIGNVDAISLNSIQHQLLHDFVSERGGALLMLAGNNTLSDGGWYNSPVATALPVELRPTTRPTYARIRAKVSLTANGQYSAITRFDPDPDVNQELWSELPELADFQLTTNIKPGATTLLEAQIPGSKHPLLAFQPYGKGKTYLLASSGTWRWQMQLPHADQRHEIFWQQLLQTIAASATERMTIATDRQIYSDNPVVKISANLLSDEFEPVASGEITALLTAPDGSEQTVTLLANPENAGEFATQVEAPDTGSWQIDINASKEDQPIATATRWINREDGSAESYALAQNAALLNRISNTTGGQYWSTANAAQIPAAIREARNGLVQLQTLPLWNMPLFFLLILGLKLLEWVLRMIWGRL